MLFATACEWGRDGSHGEPLEDSDGVRHTLIEPSRKRTTQPAPGIGPRSLSRNGAVDSSGHSFEDVPRSVLMMQLI